MRGYMRRRTAGRQTAASGNAPSAGACKGNLPCFSFYHTFHAVATGRGAGAGGRGGRSPARLRRAPRAKLVGSGEAGTGCAPAPAFPLHFPVPLLLRLPALPLFCHLPHPGTGCSPAARRAALRTKSAAARCARRGCAPYPYPGIFRLNSTICISIPQKSPHRHHLG